MPRDDNSSLLETYRSLVRSLLSDLEGVIGLLQDFPKEPTGKDTVKAMLLSSLASLMSRPKVEECPPEHLRLDGFLSSLQGELSKIARGATGLQDGGKRQRLIERLRWLRSQLILVRDSLSGVGLRRLLRVSSLASGSLGNSTLIEAGGRALLIDAGIGAAEILKRLEGLRISPTSIHAILLTHEHLDHIEGAGALARQLDVPIISNEPTLRIVQSRTGDARMDLLQTGSPLDIAGFLVQSFPVPHDAMEPVGYSVSYGQWKVCIATDLGKVTDEVRVQIADANLVILDANHHSLLLRRGLYIPSVKGRIESSEGHLSLDDAAKAILEHPRRESCLFWLAHLSEVNNSPALAYMTVSLILKAEGVDADFRVLLRDRVSESWFSPHGMQLEMF